MHLLGWRFPGLGRYDHHEGKVPLAQRREDAEDMARQHGAEISEWNLQRQKEWPTTTLFDEDLTLENPHGDYGQIALSDGDDSSDCEESSDERDEEEDAAMERLAELLRNPEWHPSALPRDSAKPVARLAS